LSAPTLAVTGSTGRLGGRVARRVEHVVYTSFYGAAPDATFLLARDHWATEEHLRSSGLAWTSLRDGLYLAATLTAVTGREITYGAPDWEVAAWISTYTAIAAGELAAAPDSYGHLVA
jgi:NAD(P)H dehydrogenase (quinone)